MQNIIIEPKSCPDFNVFDLAAGRLAIRVHIVFKVQFLSNFS